MQLSLRHSPPALPPFPPGPGQFELALAHAPALQAADNLLFALEAVSAVAAKHELVASFLPKLFPEEAASGRHCHFSVWRGDTNLLAHEAASAPAAAGAAAPPPCEGTPAVLGLAPDGEAFLAGVLKHLPALMVFTTPAPNSYRRLAPHCWTGAYQVGQGGSGGVDRLGWLAAFARRQASTACHSKAAGRQP